MITTVATNDITRSGVQRESSFRIKTTASAFRVLSSGLYPDKIKAVIREIAVNASDSHIAAHNPNPIEIHLPTVFEPYFSVRDYGTGIDNESMFTVYTTYFESTKTTTNEQTGSLGLGSKSPLSYVDSFSVVSFFDGMKRTYTAFKSEDGTPDLALLNEEKTQEPNGLLVQFPVLSSDFDNFKTKAQRVLRRFKGSYTITGVTDFATRPIPYLVEGSDWKLREDDGDGPIAIMGNVDYPISFNDTTLTSEQLAALKLPLDIEFAMGEVDFTASREELSYDPSTVKNIKAKLDLIIAEVRKLLGKRLDSAKSLWEARLTVYDILHGEYSIFAPLLKEGALLWNGKKVDLSPIHISEELFVQVFDQGAKFDTRASKPVDVEFTRRLQISAKTPAIFIKDKKTGALNKLKWLIRSGQHKKVYVLTPLNPKEISRPVGAHTSLNWQAPSETKQIKIFLKDLGMTDESYLQRVSSLPTPPRRPRAAVVDNRASVLVYNNRSSYRPKDNWNKAEIDITTGGIFVPVHRFRINDIKPDRYFDSIYADMKGIKVDLSKLQIYGVKKSIEAKLVALKNNKGESLWVSVNDYAKRQVEKELGRLPNLSDMVAKSQAFRNFSVKLDIGRFEDAGMKKQNTFGHFIDSYNAAKKAAQNTDQAVLLEHLASRFGIAIPTAQAPIDLDGLWKNVVAKYPLLRVYEYIQPYQITHAVKYEDVANYIKLIDKK